MSNVTALKPTARDMLAGIKIIDVDTHISEWPGLWTDRAPAAYRDTLKGVIAMPDATVFWNIDKS